MAKKPPGSGIGGSASARGGSGKKPPAPPPVQVVRPPKPKPGGSGATGGPPPPPPIPKTPPKAPGSTGAAFNQFINAHPTMRSYADTIWKWSHVYGVDPAVMAALFWRESFSAAGNAKDPATIVSPAGAVGIGQIMPSHVGEKTPWGHVVTQSDLNNPEFSIRWSSWFFSQQISKYGSADRAYDHGYNPGYTGPALTSLLPKGYVPRAGLSPTEKGQTSVEQQAATASAKAVAYDKWVVRNPNGTIGFASITDASKPPKNAIRVQGGLPLTQSSLLQAKQNVYDDLYLSFQGRPAPLRAVANIMEKGLSQLGVMYALTSKPPKGPDRFIGSPIWNRTAAGIAGQAKQIYGGQWKPDRELIRKAIVESWDANTIQEKLRERPEYLQGPEFKTNVAQLSNVYQSIYGTPNSVAQQTIKEAAANQWTADQFASWLRGQPEYTTSHEYTNKSLAVAQALGLVTGQVAVLRPGQAPANTQPAAGVLPNNPLVSGKPQGTGQADQPQLVVGTL
jgi:hypothetical protein